MKSANERIAFHQKKDKKRQKKTSEKRALLEKVKMAAKKLKREHYSLPAKINNSKRIKKLTQREKKRLETSSSNQLNE